MAPRNVSLLIIWLLAAAICVTYMAVGREPVPRGHSISAQHDDLQRLRDRPLGSWGPYLPRPVLSKEMPRTAIAKAPPLGSEQPTIIKRLEKPKQRVVEVPEVKRMVPYSSEPSPVAQAKSRKRSQKALLDTKHEQLALKRTPAKVEKPKPTAKLYGARKKVIAEGHRAGLRDVGKVGLGLFALSGDFGRPTQATRRGK